MPGFDGTGPNGMGPMTGGGRGFCNPWGVKFRQYAFPHPINYALPHYGTYGYWPPASRVTREQGLEFLRGQAEALRDELKELEVEIGKLSTNKE
jgi:hypothetical protein